MLVREVLLPRGAFELVPPGSVTAVAVQCQLAFTRLRATAMFRLRR